MSACGTEPRVGLLISLPGARRISLGDCRARPLSSASNPPLPNSSSEELLDSIMQDMGWIRLLARPLFKEIKILPRFSRRVKAFGFPGLRKNR